LPAFPGESFFAWAKKRGLTAPVKHAERKTPKIAYFAGCSAGYLFPGVAKAAVGLLEQNGIQVFVPSQHCCSMPLIMEGNRQAAKKRIQANLETLGACVQDGYNIVCSCPTCGYFFKKLLKETAYYSEAFQHRANAGDNRMQVPTGSRDQKFTTVPMGIYKTFLKDDGYFSGIDPLQRIDLSLNVQDLGEYLLARHKTGQISISLKEPGRPLAYFAPCHQREQNIGHPYVEMIQSLPGTDILPVGGEMHCCGMGGHLGFKTDFHGQSLAIGDPLFDRLAAASGRTVITDCLSCRMQLQHVFSRQVFHPLELLTAV
jgi:glycerol-3-phosphate dehydrogenase subunit C